MKSRSFISLAGALVLTAGLATAALAAGFFNNGLPSATSTTGAETLAADTNLPSGVNPASEGIPVSLVLNGTFVTASNATSFTGTAAQVSGNSKVNLLLTGAPSTAQTLTLPTATLLVANLPFATVGSTWLLHVVNVGGTASGVWTVATATGLTLTGNMTVPVAGSRTLLLTFTNVTTTPAATVQDLGS